MHDQHVLEAYVDNFIVGLLRQVGLKVKISRNTDITTLKITLKRAPKTS